VGGTSYGPHMTTRQGPRRRGTVLSGAALLVLVAVFTACEQSAPLPSPSPADLVQPLPAGADGTVDRVVDGDTVVVDGRSVRLIGVDTPETVKQGAPVGCYGPEASRATKALLPVGERVRLVADRESTDRFGRDLRYVYRLDDGLFVQSYLVRFGFARTLFIEPNVARREPLAALRTEADAAGRGLWGAC
jgi:micrococcal nuclease